MGILPHRQLQGRPYQSRYEYYIIVALSLEYPPIHNFPPPSLPPFQLSSLPYSLLLLPFLLTPLSVSSSLLPSLPPSLPPFQLSSLPYSLLLLRFLLTPLSVSSSLLSSLPPFQLSSLPYSLLLLPFLLTPLCLFLSPSLPSSFPPLVVFEGRPSSVPEITEP